MPSVQSGSVLEPSAAHACGNAFDFAARWCSIRLHARSTRVWHAFGRVWTGDTLLPPLKENAPEKKLKKEKKLSRYSSLARTARPMSGSAKVEGGPDLSYLELRVGGWGSPVQAPPLRTTRCRLRTPCCTTCCRLRTTCCKPQYYVLYRVLQPPYDVLC